MAEISTNQPLVGIIIINWNSYEDTAECLDSVFKSNYENHEVYVVDNGSSDNSFGQLKAEFSGVKFVQNSSNLGFSTANNIGIKKALSDGAEYILLLNNDTIVSNGFIEPLVSVHEQYEDCGISSGKIYNYPDVTNIWYSGGDINESTFRVKHYEEDSSSIDEVTDIPGCLMCISKDTIKDIGLLKEEYFLYSEDTEYCYRAYKNNHSMYVNRESIIFHKNSSSSRTSSAPPALRIYYLLRNRIHMIREYKDLYQRFLPMAYLISWHLAATALWAYRGWWEQIGAILRGVVHGMLGVTGKCDQYH